MNRREFIKNSILGLGALLTVPIIPSIVSKTTKIKPKSISMYELHKVTNSYFMSDIETVDCPIWQSNICQGEPFTIETLKRMYDLAMKQSKQNRWM